MVDLAEKLRPDGCPFLLIGDKKGPFEYNLPGATLVSLSDQTKLPHRIVPLLKTGHYARKNIGYLMAFERRAPFIYETDDDNAPLPSWRLRSLNIRATTADTQGWLNVYRYFSGENIWPRGLPLDHILDPLPELGGGQVDVEAPIQQGLADGSPDVDATWRLVLDKPITFNARSSILLAKGTWCPFNSQTTWWWPVAYPLMYLPSYCTFRMTDIWRSFIAQRCLWELGMGIAFHAAEVVQSRNVHNLMRDFCDEIPGYTQNDRIIKLLSELTLEPGGDRVCENLLRCYEHLVAGGIFPAEELELVQAWVSDLKNCGVRPAVSTP